VKEEFWDWLDKYSTDGPDEMHIHSLRDKYIPRKNELVMQRAWRHRATSNPQPWKDFMQSLQVKFTPNTGHSVCDRGSQIIPCGTVRRRKEQLEWSFISLAMAIMLQQADKKRAYLCKFVRSPCPSHCLIPSVMILTMDEKANELVFVLPP
jgi:hypothetical protein